MDRLLSFAKTTPRAAPSGNNRVPLRLGIRLGSARSNPYSHFFVVSLDHTDRERQPVGGIPDRRQSPRVVSLDLGELAGRNRFPLWGVPPPQRGGGCSVLVPASGSAAADLTIPLRVQHLSQVLVMVVVVGSWWHLEKKSWE